MIYLIMSSKPIFKKKNAPCDLDVFLSSLVGINYVEPKSYCSFIITVDKQYECNICDFKTYYLNWRLKNSLILGEMWRICCHQNQKYNHILMKWQDCSCLPLEVYQKRNTYHIYRIKFKKKIRTPNRNFKPNRWSFKTIATPFQLKTCLTVTRNTSF